MTRTQAKGQVVSKVRVETNAQTDTRTDRADCITCRANDFSFKVEGFVGLLDQRRFAPISLRHSLQTIRSLGSCRLYLPCLIERQLFVFYIFIQWTMVDSHKLQHVLMSAFAITCFVFIELWIGLWRIFTNRFREGGIANASERPSVRPFVSTLSSELTDR